jgi:ABC-type multidrug transport system ATPase subunit
MGLKLTIEGISQRYRGGVWALRNVSLELEAGILGLVGPNGAGKSTLMRILATVSRPTEGRVTWNGTSIVKAPDELRSVLGYLPQDFGIYPHLNAVEFLEYLAAIKGIDGRNAHRRIDELLQAFGLVEVRKRPLGGFSGGMKQRVGIAQALLNEPQLLIVDEPTSGLDPEERVRFRNLLAELAGDRVVILSTHIVSDVEAAATTVAILNEGRLLWHAAPEDLLQSVEGKVWEWVAPSTEVRDIRERFPVSNALRRADGVHLRLVADSAPSPEARRLPPTLEDAYLHQISAGREGGGSCTS